MTVQTVLRSFMTVLAFLTLVGGATAQSLYEVVISISERKRVVDQQAQVITYLRNQSNPPGATDPDLPPDVPLDWFGVGTRPAQSSIDGLAIGGKIALLDQAVTALDNLKFAFLNSSPDEFKVGATVGFLRPYEHGDFSPLPKATHENYHDLLRLLAQRVITIRPGAGRDI